jgi:hypothetical protein
MHVISVPEPRTATSMANAQTLREVPTEDKCNTFPIIQTFTTQFLLRVANESCLLRLIRMRVISTDTQGPIMYVNVSSRGSSPSRSLHLQFLDVNTTVRHGVSFISLFTGRLRKVNETIVSKHLLSTLTPSSIAIIFPEPRTWSAEQHRHHGILSFSDTEATASQNTISFKNCTMA